MSTFWLKSAGNFVFLRSFASTPVAIAVIAVEKDRLQVAIEDCVTAVVYEGDDAKQI